MKAMYRKFFMIMGPVLVFSPLCFMLFPHYMVSMLMAMMVGSVVSLVFYLLQAHTRPGSIYTLIIQALISVVLLVLARLAIVGVVPMPTMTQHFLMCIGLFLAATVALMGLLELVVSFKALWLFQRAAKDNDRALMVELHQAFPNLLTQAQVELAAKNLILSAVDSEHVPTLQWLLSLPCVQPYQLSLSSNLLQYAAQIKHQPSMAFLLQQPHFNPNQSMSVTLAGEQQQLTPLHYAIHFQQQETIDLLLNTDGIKPDYAELLKTAITRSDLSSFKKLVEHRVLVLDESNDDLALLLTDLLFYACHKQQHEITEFLLKQQALDPNQSMSVTLAGEQQQLTPLHYAIHFQQQETIDLLLNTDGIKPDYAELLKTAIDQGNLSLCEQLMEHTEHVSDKTKEERAGLLTELLIYACYKQQYEITAFLLKQQDLDPNLPGAVQLFGTSSEMTPLHYAICCHQEETIDLLLKTDGIKPDYAKHLESAIARNDVSVFNKLLEHRKCVPDESNDELALLITDLLFAALPNLSVFEKIPFEIIDSLLKHSHFNPNQTASMELDGRTQELTPLHYLIELDMFINKNYWQFCYDRDLIQDLQKVIENLTTGIFDHNNFDPNAATSHGVTPLYHSFSIEHTIIFEKLLTYSTIDLDKAPNQLPLVFHMIEDVVVEEGVSAKDKFLCLELLLNHSSFDPNLSCTFGALSSKMQELLLLVTDDLNMEQGIKLWQIIYLSFILASFKHMGSDDEKYGRIIKFFKLNLKNILNDPKFKVQAKELQVFVAIKGKASMRISSRKNLLPFIIFKPGFYLGEEGVCSSAIVAQLLRYGSRFALRKYLNLFEKLSSETVELLASQSVFYPDMKQEVRRFLQRNDSGSEVLLVHNRQIVGSQLDKPVNTVGVNVVATFSSDKPQKFYADDLTQGSEPENKFILSQPSAAQNRALLQRLLGLRDLQSSSNAQDMERRRQQLIQMYMSQDAQSATHQGETKVEHEHNFAFAKQRLSEKLYDVNDFLLRHFTKVALTADSPDYIQPNAPSLGTLNQIATLITSATHLGQFSHAISNCGDLTWIKLLSHHDFYLFRALWDSSNHVLIDQIFDVLPRLSLDDLDACYDVLSRASYLRQLYQIKILLPYLMALHHKVHLLEQNKPDSAQAKWYKDRYSVIRNAIIKNAPFFVSSAPLIEIDALLSENGVLNLAQYYAIKNILASWMREQAHIFPYDEDMLRALTVSCIGPAHLIDLTQGYYASCPRPDTELDGHASDDVVGSESGPQACAESKRSQHEVVAEAGQAPAHQTIVQPTFDDLMQDMFKKLSQTYFHPQRLVFSQKSIEWLETMCRDYTNETIECFLGVLEQQPSFLFSVLFDLMLQQSMLAIESDKDPDLAPMQQEQESNLLACQDDTLPMTVSQDHQQTKEFAWRSSLRKLVHSFIEILTQAKKLYGSNLTLSNCIELAGSHCVTAQEISSMMQPCPDHFGGAAYDMGQGGESKDSHDEVTIHNPAAPLDVIDSSPDFGLFSPALRTVFCAAALNQEMTIWGQSYKLQLPKQ